MLPVSSAEARRVALASLACGLPELSSERALAERLRLAAARGSGWLRGVGYHESLAGPLDRDRLDAWVSRRPLRVQHRSGALWILNSPACRASGLDVGVDAPGVERDASGRATGRLFRLDAWLREQLGAQPLPDLAPVGALLARYGVPERADPRKPEVRRLPHVR